MEEFTDEANEQLIAANVLLDRHLASVPAAGSAVPPSRWADFGHRLGQVLAQAKSDRIATTMPITLPTQLLAGNEAQAEELLRGYLEAVPANSGGVAYTGSQFDVWDGGGDRAQVANVFTDADIVAVSMLSVDVPAQAVIELMLRRRGELTELLENIPANVDLHRAPAELIKDGSTAWRLWETLDSIPGLGDTTVSKLLARKRPRLLPIYDKYVAQYLGPVRDYWEALRHALSADNDELALRLRGIGDRVGASGLSILRVFDIVAWRSAGN